MVRDFFTASEVAQEAGVSGSWVARLCREGAIPATKVGSVWLIKPEDAEAWLQRRREEPPTPGRPRKKR